MNLTRASIEKNRVTVTVLIVVLLAGWLAFNTLPRAEDPGFTIRVAQIITRFPGASAQRVEELVTDRLEKAIQEIPELDFVSSTSKTGLSVIAVNIKERYKKMRPIWDTLRRKINREAENLPAGVKKPVINDEFGDVFGIVLSLTGDGYTYRQLKTIADQMRDDLLALPDVAKVEIIGTQEQRIFIEYSDAKLAKVGFSANQLSQILQAQNIVNTGGDVLVGEQRIAIEPSGNFESVADIENTVVALPKTGALVALKDIVTVRRGYVDPPAGKSHTATGTAIFNDKRFKYPHKKPATAALVIAVSMREGGLITALGEQVDKQLATFNQTYPIGIQIEKTFYQPTDVQAVIDDFVENLLQAVVIVMVAMLLFLGPRTGLVVAALIPTAIAATLMFMNVFGIGLNQMSLAALIIALGMLVDNGVVMAESTLISIEGGSARNEAAIRSAKELGVPLLVSSLTTAAAFLPIALAKSAVGEYCIALFQVVTIALLSSWVLSLTMTPTLCSLMLKSKPKPKKPFSGAFYRGYRRFLLTFVRFPLVSIIVMFMLLMGTMTLFKYVPKIFFPDSDRPTFEIELQLLPGTAIEKTTHLVQKLERQLHQNYRQGEDKTKHGIVNWSTFVGRGGPRYYLGANPEPANSGYAQFLVQHSDRAAMVRDMAKISAWAVDNMPEARVTLSPRSMGPPVKYPVQVRLHGTDTRRLFEHVDKLKAYLRQRGEIGTVIDNWGLRTKKLALAINQARARRAGVTSQDVATSMKAHFTGFRATEYREGEDVIPVMMRSVRADRQDLGKLETLTVTAQGSGKSVPLKQIADVKLIWEPSKVLRRDGRRTVTVSATLQPGYLAADVNKELIPWLTKQNDAWPLGYGFEIAGEAEASGKANQSINEQLPTAFFVIVMLLVGQFNSVRRSLIILLTLPLGLIGVVLGLLIAKSTFGFMTFLGVISLFGIVINNAIVLIDRIKIEIDEHGRAPAQAVVAAAQTRFRPIVLTTATTIAGLLPLWLAGSPMFQPMAVAIIFGLAFATVLTLGAVPALYSLFFRVSFKGFRYQED